MWSDMEKSRIAENACAACYNNLCRCVCSWQWHLLPNYSRQGRGNLISIGLVSLLGRSHLHEVLPDCICSYGDIYRNSISEVYWWWETRLLVTDLRWQLKWCRHGVKSVHWSEDSWQKCRVIFKCTIKNSDMMLFSVDWHDVVLSRLAWCCSE